MSDKHIRYKRLEQACDRALQKVLRQLNDWEKLASCYPTYAAKYEQQLKKMQAEIVTLWTTLCRNEFEDIFQERDVHEKLDALDDVISKAKARKEDYLNMQDELSNNIDEIDDLELTTRRQEIDENFPRINTFTPGDIVNYHKVVTQRSFVVDLEARLQSLKTVNKTLERNIDDVYQDINAELDNLNTVVYTKHLGNTSSTETISSLKQTLLLQLQEFKK